MKVYIYSMILSLAILNLPNVSSSESDYADAAIEDARAPKCFQKKQLSPEEKQRLYDEGATVRAQRAAAKALLRQKLKGTLYEEECKDDVKSEILDNYSSASDASEECKKDLNLNALQILQSKLYDSMEPTGKSQKIFAKKQYREDEATKKERRSIKQGEKSRKNKIKAARRTKNAAAEGE